MRVVVTGGAGFIGSHVVDRLLAAGIAPRIFDVRPSPHHGPDEVDAVIGDLLDRAMLQRAMHGCDAVVHLAAAADVDEVARRPAEAEAVNARGTLNVLEAARALGVARVVYASTIWVYGSATGTVDEDDAVELPDHLYTATKLAGEMYCRSYGAMYGLDCTILRFGIPYGPRARPAGVIPIFVRKALAGEPLTIAGEGLQSRRFVYVEDLAEGVVRSLAPEASGRVYNLVGEESVTIRGIADTVRDAVGDVQVVHTPARTADFAGAEVSGARAQAELGWRPATSFPDGVRHYLTWHRQQAAAGPSATVTVAEVRRRRRRPRVTPRLAVLLLSLLTVAAVAGTLLAYLSAAHAVGLVTRDEHTVGLLSIACLAAYLAVVLDSARRGGQAAVFIGWGVAAAVVVTVLMPELRETVGLTAPDLPLILLSGVGGALAIGIADAGLRLRRSSEDGLATDRV